MAHLNGAKLNNNINKLIIKLRNAQQRRRGAAAAKLIYAI